MAAILTPTGPPLRLPLLSQPSSAAPANSVNKRTVDLPLNSKETTYTTPRAHRGVHLTRFWPNNQTGGSPVALLSHEGLYVGRVGHCSYLRGSAVERARMKWCGKYCWVLYDTANRGNDSTVSDKLLLHWGKSHARRRKRSSDTTRPARRLAAFRAFGCSRRDAGSTDS